MKETVDFNRKLPRHPESYTPCLYLFSHSLVKYVKVGVCQPSITYKLRDRIRGYSVGMPRHLPYKLEFVLEHARAREIERKILNGQEGEWLAASVAELLARIREILADFGEPKTL